MSCRDRSLGGFRLRPGKVVVREAAPRGRPAARSANETSGPARPDATCRDRHRSPSPPGRPRQRTTSLSCPAPRRLRRAPARWPRHRHPPVNPRSATPAPSRSRATMATSGSVETPLSRHRSPRHWEVARLCCRRATSAAIARLRSPLRRGGLAGRHAFPLDAGSLLPGSRAPTRTRLARVGHRRGYPEAVRVVGRGGQRAADAVRATYHRGRPGL